MATSRLREGRLLPAIHPSLLVALLAGLTPIPALAATLEAKPNVILIFADDLGYGDVGCYGAKDIRTPHLDRLAAEGTRFTSFYVAQSVCTASRAALMTGSYPNRVSMSGALNHTSTTGLHPREKLLSQHFKRPGLRHRRIRQMAPGQHAAAHGESAGVRRVLRPAVLERQRPPASGHPRHSRAAALRQRRRRRGRPRPVAVHGRFTARAVSFIERNRDRPFFLYLPHVMPHVPIFASAKFRGKSARGLYGDVVEELDAGVGEIMATLRRLGLDEKTLVVFTSDNGPFLSYGEHAGLSGPLREGKLTTFEGGHRTPCLVRWPGRVPAGRVNDEPWSTMDFHVSVAKLIGATLPNTKLDGVDVRPLLFGEPGRRAATSSGSTPARNCTPSVRATGSCTCRMNT
jgi:arylsulfatase A-like enzyme